MPFMKETIDELCTGADIPRWKLAGEIGKPESTLWRWANGRSTPEIHNIDLLYEIATKYGIDGIEFYQRPGSRR